MKKLIIIILLSLTGNSFSQNSLWVDTLSSGPNQEVQFTINTANSQSFTAFQLDITLPASLDYKANSLQLDPTRKVDHVITGSIISGNVLRIISYSLTKKNFNGSNGTVAVFSCIAKTTPGDYYLVPGNIVISDTNNAKLSFNSFNGKYTLLAPAINIGISNINFGSIPLGQTYDQSIPVTNNGNLPLSVSAFSSNSSEMKCLDSSAVIIQPLQTIYRTVRFAPVKKGNKTGAITIKSNDPLDSIKTIALTGIGFAVNEIHVGSLNGRSGQQGDLTVSINNMDPFTAFEFTLALPSVMQYVFGSAVLLRNTNHLVSVDTINGNSLRVVSYSPDNETFTGTNGDVLKLSFSLLGQGGGYSIPVSNAIISDTTNTNIISASYAGSMQIASPYLSLSSSQINYGSVSITDTDKVNITLYNYGTDTLKISSITSNNSYFFVNETYPIIILQGNQRNIAVNFHGISKGNYTGQLTINSNDAPRNPSYISLSGSLFVPNTLSVTSESGCVNDTIAVPFTIENMDQFTAFQFDVTLPSEAAFIPNSVVLNSLRANGHSLSYSIQPNGALRILAFSLNQNLFKSNSGEVVRFNVKLNSPLGTYPITISNLLIGNVLNQNIASGFNNGNIEIDNPLPVELNSFSTKCIINNISLMWETKSEINSSFFIVERSISKDGNISYWQKIGEMKASGNSNSPKEYSYLDKNLNSAKYQYRLKMVDDNGSFNYIKIIEAEVAAPKMFNVSQNYPNPFNPSTVINYTIPFEGSVSIRFYNSIGQLISEVNESTRQAGYYDLNFSASGLSSGIYFYSVSAVSSDGKITLNSVKKMMILK